MALLAVIIAGGKTIVPRDILKSIDYKFDKADVQLAKYPAPEK